MQLPGLGLSFLRLTIFLFGLWLIPLHSAAQNVGSALNFDGVDDYIELPHSPSLNISSAISLEMWVNTTTSSNAVLLEKSSNNTNYGLHLNLGKIVFFVSPDANTGQLVSNGSINNGQWHHISVTFNDVTNTMSIYIDGVLDNTSSSKTASISPNNQPIYIGSRSGTLSYEGGIDEIRIWDRDLCLSEIQNNMAGTLPAGQTGLVAIYNLNQGVAGGNNNGVTVPGQPAIASLSAGNGQVTVGFSQPYNGGTPITAYTVTSTPGGITATGSTSPVIVSGLMNGTAYTFTVTATNSAGTSVASAPSASVTPQGEPGAPTAVAAVSLGLNAASVSFAAPSNNGAPITGYTVYSTPGNITATGTGAPIVISGLTAGVSYSFVVRATNIIGLSQPSAPSAPLVLTTVPGAPSISAVAFGNTQVSVQFTPPASNGGAPIISYTAVSTPGNFTATGSGSPLTVSGLTNGTSYTFRVSATNVIGTGALSNASAAVTPKGPPTAPTNVIAHAITGFSDRVSVAFNAPTNNGGAAITGYTVTRSPGGFTVTGVTSPIIVTGLIAGASYTFTVRATNVIGSSPNSFASPLVTLTGPPGAPTITATSAMTSTSASVSFNPPSNSGGLPISYYTVTSSPGGFSWVGASSPITVGNLTPGSTYTFTVRATNLMGAGPFSAPSQPLTMPGNALPGSVFLVYNASLQHYINAESGNVVNLNDGSETNPIDGSTQVNPYPPGLLPPFIQTNQANLFASFDAASGRVYSYRYSYLDVIQGLEFDMNGEPFATVDPPLYIITDDLKVVDLLDGVSDMTNGVLRDPITLQPITGNVEAFTPLPTPDPWKFL